MRTEDMFDWKTNNDARLLAEYNALQNDPARLKKAKECAQAHLKDWQQALGKDPTPKGTRNLRSVAENILKRK